MASKGRIVFVDAMALTQQNMSGVGHNALEIVRALDRMSVTNNFELRLIVTLGKKRALTRHNLNARIKIKQLLLPARIIEVLLRTRLLPPIDLFLGRGLYIFPNYKKMPLARSQSYLYIHDIVFARHPEYVQPKNLRYLKKYLPGWVQSATKVVTISEFSKADIKDYFAIASDKIIVVPCGVDRTVFYKREKSEIATVKAKYGITSRDYFIYVGNFEPRKNISRIIRAMGALPIGQKQDYGLALIGGGGWLNDDIDDEISRARKRGLTIFTPDVYVADGDLPALLSGSVALVHPAHYEGFGLSVLQAMACGTPVIVAKNSSIPELVGDAGIYVDPMSEASINEGMLNLVSNQNLHVELAKEGLKRAQLFDWDESVRILLRDL